MNLIVKLAANAPQGGKKYVLVAGAGVSKDAGKPTAWDLMLTTASLLYAADEKEPDPQIDLEEWFIGSEYSKMSYAELIEKIYPNYPDQQSFLKSNLGNKEVGQAHRAIAELARRGIIRAIVTTNFDRCIERALEEKGLDIQVISTDEDLKNSEPLIQCKVVRIYKPHGDLGRGALRNTPADLESLSPFMKQELIRTFNDHGIIVLGYSGRDKGMQEVFEARDSGLYPIFWINPSPPKGEIEKILTKKGYDYIHCTGANQFIEDFFKILERLKDLAPGTAMGPTIADLKTAFASGKEPLGPLYADYLEKIYANFEETRPDFTKHEEYDDGIVSQIEKSIKVSYDFIEATLLASRYANFDALKQVYEFFSNMLRLYRVSGPGIEHRGTDFDGYKFLGYEMMVSFVAALIKYGHWDYIGEILSQGLLVERIDGTYLDSFMAIYCSVPALDDLRNKRLKLNRWSVASDLLKERFTKSELSQLLTHKEFMAADYFLFMRTVCQKDDLKYLYDVWCPKSCVDLEQPPIFIIRAQSARFLKKLSTAAGFDNPAEFVAKLKTNHACFLRFFYNRFHDLLQQSDLDKLGTFE